MKVGIITASKEQEYKVVRKALEKLPRDDMRALCRKLGVPTGHQKAHTVNNLARALTGE